MKKSQSDLNDLCKYFFRSAGGTLCKSDWHKKEEIMRKRFDAFAPGIRLCETPLFA